MASTTLVEELVEEILIRLPPEEPAHLFRTALVCKAWRRIVSDYGFLRRYSTFHGTPPLLGCIENPNGRVCFYPTSAASPVSAAALTLKTTLDRGNSVALDCRHGRVLIRILTEPERLIVWHPITSSQQHLIVPAYPYGDKSCCTGSVLCATKSCDHLDCGGGPFSVVFAWTWMNDAMDGTITWASIYSSETGAWRAPTSIDTIYYIHMRPATLIGDALYFNIANNEGLRSVLKYDLCEHGLSVIDVPRLHCCGTVVIMGEGGGLLRLVTLLDNCIYVWSQQDITNGIHRWVKNKVMDLSSLVPERGSYTTRKVIIGFAEGTDIIFINTYAEIFALNLKSRQVRKVCERETYCRMLPYMRFYTPRY